MPGDVSEWGGPFTAYLVSGHVTDLNGGRDQGQHTKLYLLRALISEIHPIQGSN